MIRLLQQVSGNTAGMSHSEFVTFQDGGMHCVFKNMAMLFIFLGPFSANARERMK